jgi:NAD-dependent dihydropyrimidine dehydrogenase PreA subunit
MALPYVITSACLDVKDRGCVRACPVQCIYELVDGSLIGRDQELESVVNTHVAHDELQHLYGDRMLYINPDECTSCDACVTECPVDAIYPGEKVPDDQAEFTDVNRFIFADISS